MLDAGNGLYSIAASIAVGIAASIAASIAGSTAGSIAAMLRFSRNHRTQGGPEDSNISGEIRSSRYLAQPFPRKGHAVLVRTSAVDINHFELDSTGVAVQEQGSALEAMSHLMDID